MILRLAIIFCALFCAFSSASARQTLVYLEKDRAATSRGDIAPGSEAERLYRELSQLRWSEIGPCIIDLQKSALPMVYVQPSPRPVGYIRFDSLENLYTELLPEMRGTLRWMDGDAFLMAANDKTLKRFLIASGAKGRAAAFHEVVPGSGMTYVVPAAHLNAAQRAVCFNDADGLDDILAKAKLRKEYRSQSAYNMWELLSFPLDTPLRFYRCESTADIASLLHDTLLSMKPIGDDRVAKEFSQTTKAVRDEEVKLAIACFYQALNNSDKEIRSMLHAVATTLAKLPAKSSDEAIRRAMVELFCTRIMASPNMQQAVMELAAEIADTLEGELIDRLSVTMKQQVAKAFAAAVKGRSDAEVQRFRASGRILFERMHKAFLGYFTDSTGVTRWFAYHLGPYVDNRALILDRLFGAAIDGLR